MSPEQEILDIEALLQPISADAPSGVNLRPLGVYDDVKALRTTESADSMVGTLRPGEYKTAQWGKAAALCIKELSTRSKDLQLAVWLAEALVRVHGFRGLVRGLEFVLALNQRFFPTYYPPIEDGGLDMRSGRLAELERLLTQAIDASAMTAKVDGETHAFWEWKQIQILFSNASRAKPEEKDAILAEANTKKEAIDKAVAKTSWEFYDDGILQPLIRSQEILTELRETADRLFAAEPTFGEMEDSVTGFSDLRKELDEVRLRVEGILDEKPAPPGKGRNAAPADAGRFRRCRGRWLRRGPAGRRQPVRRPRKPRRRPSPSGLHRPVLPEDRTAQPGGLPGAARRPLGRNAAGELAGRGDRRPQRAQRPARDPGASEEDRLLTALRPYRMAIPPYLTYGILEVS